MDAGGFDLSMTARLDAASFTSGAAQADTALDGVAQATTRATGAAESLGKASEAAAKGQAQMAREAQELRDKLDPIAAAQRKVNEELAKARRLYEAGAITQREFIQVQQLSEKALKAGVASIGAQRQAYTQLGFQVQDIVSTLSLGINPLVVLAQQGGQTASALSGFGGTVGKVATFMAGPWGSAILGATTVLGLLIPKLLEGGDAASQMASQQDVLARFVDRTTGKLREQIVAVQALAQVQAEQKRRQSQEGSYLAARGNLVNTARQALQPGALFGGGPFSPAVGLPAEAQGKSAEALKKLVDQYERGAINANKFGLEVRNLAKTDPALAKLAGTVTVLASRTVDSAQAYQKTQATIRVLSGTATDADKALLGFKDATDKVNVGLVEAQARVNTATTALAKAQANLDLVREKGRAQVRAGTLDEKAYQAQVEEAQRAVNAASEAQKGAAASHRAAAKEAREAAKAVREAAREDRELESALDGLARKYNPVLAAERERIQALKQIAALLGAGKITQGEADVLDRKALLAEFDSIQEAWDKDVQETFSHMPDYIRQNAEKPLTNVTDKLDEQLQRAAQRFGQALGTSGSDAVQDIGKAVGGKTGRVIEALGAIAGGNNGQPVGGSRGIGGIISALSYTGRTDQNGKPVLSSFGQGVLEQQQGLGGTLNGVFNKVFGEQGIFGGTLGKTLGKAFGGAQTGSLVNSIVAPLGKALGVKTSKTGAQIGGAIGSALPIPGGDIIGSVIGSVVGGLFKKTPRASATVTGANGQVTVGGASGTSAALRTQASGLGSSVQSGLQAIADQLNATLGNFAVSVGIRNKNYRVDPSGQNRTKTSKGAIDFGQDEAAAIYGAIGVAIGQGAIQGVSQAVQQALRSSKDTETAVREALKVQEVEDILAGVSDGVRKALRDFDKQAAERVRIARQYGFDVVAIEKKNAEDRKAIIDEAMASTVGSLQQLLQDFATGDLFEGDAAQRRQALLDKIGTTKQDALAGKAGAADTLAGLYRQLTETSRESFGTAGGEYAADRNLAQTGAQAVIEAERKRIEDADAQTKAQTQALQTANTLQNEANGFLSEQSTFLQQIRDAVAGGGGGSFVAAAFGGRTSLLDRNTRMN